MSKSPVPPHLDQTHAAEQLLAHFEQLEAQFHQLREGLTHSHRLATLGTLASVIAHEYNNILTPVISYAQMALAKPEDTEFLRKALEKALQGAERATSISASLLGFAREGDQQRVAHLPTVVQDAITCMGRDPKRDGIDLIIDVPELRVAMSPLNLQQVLLNLLLNARQAMRKRGGQLRVSASLDNHQVHIAVTDTGPGIPEEVRAHLFEPFVTHRPDGESSGERKGTGLGLCICRDLIVNASGSIVYDTQTGHGTTFHILLPQAEQAFEST